MTSLPSCKMENWRRTFLAQVQSWTPTVLAQLRKTPWLSLLSSPSDDCDERWHGHTTHISAGRDASAREGDGLKPPNSYLVGCKIFTAWQDLNSSWVLDMTGWLLLKRRPQSQDVVNDLQSSIGAFIVLVGQSELWADKGVKQSCKTRECITKADYQCRLETHNIYFTLYLIYICSAMLLHQFLVSTFCSLYDIYWECFLIGVGGSVLQDWY